ncbi:MAG: ribosome silencing factor [Pseudomonadota bacterium]
MSLVLASLDQDGALDVVEIDLAGKSDMADFMVVASGRSSRHVSAVSEKLIERLKQEAGVIAKTEGRESADWILIDAGDVIVHLFRPEVREYYQIEKMWLTAPDVMARQA